MLMEGIVAGTNAKYPLAVDALGRLITTNQANAFSVNATITNSVASTLLKAASGAGVRAYITDLVLSNNHSAAVSVTILDNATGLVGAILIPAGATIVIPFSTPLKGSANTVLNAQLSAAVAGAVVITAIGFTGA